MNHAPDCIDDRFAAHTLDQVFRAQCARTPDAMALRFRDKSLCYGELNRRANQVAHILRSKGIRPGQLVGLYLDRSLELLVGLLGILKAGAAYLPIIAPTLRHAAPSRTTAESPWRSRTAA
jgi:non-ribosomal peptide synthetase component F